MSMKYRNCKVVSHPRAGSHYLAHLLNINFYHFSNYLSLYAGHSSQHVSWLRQSSTCVIYIHRNIEDSVKSMFKLKNRFGLVCTTLQGFERNTLSDMHYKNIKSCAVVNIGGNKRIVTDVDTALRNIQLTPGQYIQQHHNQWISRVEPNFLPVSYENLTEFFDSTMLHIAQFLGSNKTTFTNETNRIGWYDNSEDKKIFT